ncbi:MAG: SCO family protein [Candidatus Thiodiazotropha sp.]|nr:SCO family protein [Candidatus Thiodiazotropha taylori]MBT3059605.1 SCO family protein [Candidatus Thiodiazotropha sp. (ex Lucina pensylvanica)]MBV2093734.1 SCO family protein [Candidatus Thiodiazotropha sp. (ex Codakia orbicularis)]PUB72130.1 MAG: SCO family protein [gamma proteobacterium symbiont of Ctena orbiculata]PUB80332.1 MAG: SCO family protein [gamma proteobacterium symbiont of Ctena orbiculata]
MSPGRRFLGLLLAAVLPLAVSWADSEELGGNFRLTDHNGRPFELDQLKGRLVLLFFGYTYCPDICPTELANLSAVLNALDDQAERVQGLFVTLDPGRDTPEVLQDYVRHFNRRLVGLTGSEEEVAQVARQYRVSYQRHERENGDYSIDHSVNLYLIDAQGALSAVVPYGLPPQHLLETVQGHLAGMADTDALSSTGR